MTSMAGRTASDPRGALPRSGERSGPPLDALELVPDDEPSAADAGRAADELESRLRTPVTLREVAARAGVHPSTASRALNERTRPTVNTATAARVALAAKKLGYQPNSLARGLRTKRTLTVGMLLPDLTNPLFPPIVRGIEDRLGARGYTLILANTDNNAAKERALLDVMAARRVDGLILATARRQSPIFENVFASGMPVVLVNRTTDNAAVASVAGDDHAGIGLAVRHLVSLGHRRIAFVGATRAVSTGLGRYQSFLSWIQSEGLEVDHELIVFAEWFKEEPGAAAFRELLDRKRDFTAVVAGNDLIALGCYEVVRELGLRVPADISVVGYNDIPFSDKFSPPLTTVRSQDYQIGFNAAGLLLDSIDGVDVSAVSLRLTPTLVVRESTGHPSR